MLFVTLLGVLSLAASLHAQTMSNSGCPSGQQYTVQPGDTYCAIAARLGCSSYTYLQSANNGIAPQSLQPGNTFCIPASPQCGTGAKPADSACGGSGSSGCTTYTVQPGDTYCAIAAKLGCSSYTYLQSANNGIAPQNLQPGNTFCIPASPQCGTGAKPADSACSTGAPLVPGSAPSSSCPYAGSTPIQATPIIPNGGTYCQFAQQYGCGNVSTLIAANGQGVYTLNPGSAMCIPAPSAGCTGSPLSYTPAGCCANSGCPTGYTYYCVQPNDSWCSIEAATGCNNLASVQAQYGTSLTMGQQLCIPNSCASCKATVPLTGNNTVASVSTQWNCDLADYYSGCPLTTATVCIPNNCPIYNGISNGILYCNGVSTGSSSGCCNGQCYCNGNTFSGGYCNGQLYCNGAVASNTTGMTGFCGNTFYCSGTAQSVSSNGLYYCGSNYYCSANGGLASTLSGNQAACGYRFCNGQYCGQQTGASATTCSAVAASSGLSKSFIACCNGMSLNSAGDCTLPAYSYY